MIPGGPGQTRPPVCLFSQVLTSVIKVIWLFYLLFWALP